MWNHSVWRHCCRQYSSSAKVFNSNNTKSSSRMIPTYQIYGEECAFTLKAILPQFRQISGKSSLLVLDKGSRGRFLFEWTPRNPDGRYSWDVPIRFALSPEEAGLLVAKVASSQQDESPTGIEFVRTPPKFQGSSSSSSSKGYEDIMEDSNDSSFKIFKLLPERDGSVQFAVDFVSSDDVGGQEPWSVQESRGPLEVTLLAGEYQVIKSIIDYSIPRLVGWSTMLENAIENSIADVERNDRTPDPHRYHSRGSDLPF